MSHFGALVDPSRTNEWNTILQRVLEDKHKKNPGCPLSEAYAEAWVQFQEENWQSMVESGVGLSKKEYAKMDAGPDLTALSRSRFGVVKKKASKKNAKPRALSNYNKFMKIAMDEHKEEWKGMSLPDKVRKISEIWKAMSDEDKMNYK